MARSAGPLVAHMGNGAIADAVDLPSEPLGSGTVIDGKYRLGPMLGLGGMGRVFRAQHLLLNQPVAIKVLSIEEGEFKERFLREALAAQALHSEHVVRVFDVGVLPDGCPYLVMEHLEGQDLFSILKREGPLEASYAVDLVLQACEGIGEAHARGIVHRDLKPSNLYVCRRTNGAPMVKVLDFGISKLSSQALRHASLKPITVVRSSLGSPIFMAPEQMRDASQVDARADIWALGVVLYMLLENTPPYTGTTIEELSVTIATTRPRSLTSTAEAVRLGLAQVIDGCLTFDRSERLPSVAALATALRPFASSIGQLSADRVIELYGALPIGAAAIRPEVFPSARLAFSSQGESTAQDPLPQRVHKPTPLSVAMMVLVSMALLATGVVLATRTTEKRDALKSTNTSEAPSAPVAPPVNPALAAETDEAPLTLQPLDEQALRLKSIKHPRRHNSNTTAAETKPAVKGKGPTLDHNNVPIIE